MRSLYAALAAATLAFLLVAIVFRPLYAIVPALVALGAVFFLLMRRHAKAAEARVTASMEHLKKQDFDAAIAELKKAHVHTPWVFLLAGQIDGQIGIYLYVQKKFDESRPYLERAWTRLWLAKAMLAADLFRHHKADLALKELDLTIKDNKKEPLLYGLKAWMHIKLKERDKAQQCLAAGLVAVPAQPALQEQLKTVQNGDELDMRAFGDAWWQFHLEKPSQKDIARLMGTAAGPRFDRRSMFR